MLNDACDNYFKWYYETGVWKTTYYRGHRTLKCVSDMWNYQEIIHERNVQWVIETGTRHGGSALFFADLLTARNASGKVLSIDIDAESNTVLKHPKIEFIYGDSTSPDMVEFVKSLLPEDRGSIFLILDSDHAKQHVYRELTAYVPLMRSGDYLIVEDTCVNGHPVRQDFGMGPWEAIHSYLEANPNILVADKSRENKFGFSAAPEGFYFRR